jgi:hypothetical protein
VKRGFLGDSQAGLLENDRPESPRKNQASPFSAPPRLRGEVLVFARRISGLALMVPTKPNLSCRNVDFSAIAKQDFWKTIDLPLDERTRLSLSPRLRVSVVRFWFRSARVRPRPYGANQAKPILQKRGFLGDSQARLLENDRPASQQKNHASPFSASPRLRGEALGFVSVEYF